MSSITICNSDHNHISILEALRKQGMVLSAPCGGNGTCGKCSVKLTRDGITSTVLACQTASRDLDLVEISNDSILSRNTDLSESESLAVKDINDFDHAQSIGAAVDLGTTTIAVSLISLHSSEILAVKKEWNTQIAYGSDVISRTKYCMDHEHGLSELSNTVQNQIFGMIQSLCEQLAFDYKAIDNITIAGNTIMQHIFAGLDPSSIASAPYVPSTYFDDSKVFYYELFGKKPIRFMPCVSGYVGGDIVSGLYSSGLYQKEGTNLFLDIGTNGEMAIGGKDGLLSCSVASGPAFEGAAISCGMTGVNGAISHIDWKENVCKMPLQVIGDTIPIGLCGSGLIDLIAILIQIGLIDETGHLLNPKEAKKNVNRLTMARLKNTLGYKFLREDEYGNGIFYLKTNPDIYLTNEDVRKVQLAKAAISAGVHFLMEHSGESFDNIDGVYLAGGFGEHLNPENAAIIGMIPSELKDKIICIGNSSLTGAQMAQTDSTAQQTLLNIKNMTTYYELSGNSKFTDEFIEQMSFE